MSTVASFAVILITLVHHVQSALLAHREPTPFAKAHPDAIDGRKPDPTKAAVLPRYGAIENNELFARQANSDLTDDQICGWTSGDSARPITCPGSLSCAYSTGRAPQVNNVWCCPYDSDGYVVTSDCPYIAQCFNWGVTYFTQTEVRRVTAENAIYCPSQLPSCNTLKLVEYIDTSASPSASVTTYYSFGCDRVYGSFNAVQTISRSTTSTSSSTTSTTSISTTSATTAASQTSSSSSQPALSTPTPTPTPTDSSSDTAAIAGGTVGGIVGIALIAGAIGYLIYRKKKARKPTMREVDQYEVGQFVAK